MNKWVKRGIMVFGVGTCLLMLLVAVGAFYGKRALGSLLDRAGFVEAWNQNDGTVYPDLIYDEKAQLKYDLFIPANASKARSHGVCLFIHGGSWTGGSRKDMTYAARRYAKAGYITATMEHTLFSKAHPATMYQMLDEIGRAIHALKVKTGELGFTVDKLALSGVSSGGHLAMLYAYSRAQGSAIPVVLVFEQVGPTDFHPESWGNKELDTGFITAATGQQVTAAMIKSGEVETLIRSISPVAFVDERTVPTVLAYGLKDTLVRPYHFEKIVAAFKSHGVDYTLIEYPNSGHMLEADVASRDRFKQVSLEYLRRTFGY